MILIAKALLTAENGEGGAGGVIWPLHIRSHERELDRVRCAFLKSDSACAARGMTHEGECMLSMAGCLLARTAATMQHRGLAGDFAV